jgi:hypothetical protein
MPRRLPVIDDAHSPVEEWVGHSIGACTATIIDRVSWRSLGPEDLNMWRAYLILLVIGSAISGVTRGMRRYVRGFPRPPGWDQMPATATFVRYRVNR